MNDLWVWRTRIIKDNNNTVWTSPAYVISLKNISDWKNYCVDETGYQTPKQTSALTVTYDVFLCFSSKLISPENISLRTLSKRNRLSTLAISKKTNNRRFLKERRTVRCDIKRKTQFFIIWKEYFKCSLFVSRTFLKVFEANSKRTFLS